jgi:hypothetical protein
MGVHPLTDVMPGTEARGDTSALAADSTELLALAANLPVAAVASLGATANLTAITAHTATSAIAATYADLAAARTSVDALRTDAETALGEHDAALTTLRAEAEARLDAVEATLDALLAGLRTGGIVTP